MEINSQLSLKGEWKIMLRNITNNKIRIINIKNTLTKLYQDEIIKLLNGTGESIEIKYIAIGTGTTTATASDTKLETEVLRRQPTIKEVGTGYYRTTLALLPSEANIRIREIGVFFGSSATATADTGKLLSRINCDIEKTSSEELLLVRKDIIAIN